MANAPTLDFDAFVTRRKAERAEGAMEGEHDYSYVSDRQTRATFESAKPVELAVASAVRMWKQVCEGPAPRQRGEGLRPPVPAHPAASPRSAPTRSGIATPQVYIVNSPHAERGHLRHERGVVHHRALGARRSLLRRRAPHGHRPRVRPHPQLARRLPDDAPLPARSSRAPYRRRAREAGDRSRSWPGRAARRSRATAPGCSARRTRDVVGPRADEARARIAASSTRSSTSTRSSSSTRRARKASASYMEAFASHPYLPKRVLAMRVFAESALYRKQPREQLADRPRRCTRSTTASQRAAQGRRVITAGVAAPLESIRAKNEMLEGFRERKLDVTVALQELVGHREAASAPRALQASASIATS